MHTSQLIEWAVTVLSLVLVPAAAAHAKGLEPLHHIEYTREGQQESSRVTTDAARALMGGDFAKAIRLADRAIKLDVQNPWAWYVRGEALVGEGKGKQGVAALDESISRFQPKDIWGRSVALWGRARALELIGQCDQARHAFDQYEALVQRASPRNANQAKKIAGHCMPGPG